MKIIITGATGLIGKFLCEKLIHRGNDVTVFTRNVKNAKTDLPFIKNFVEWNYNNPAGWQSEIDGKDAVIHLAGANLFAKRWNEKFKEVILDSRKISTRNLAEAISKCESKPQVFITASGVNYYGDSGDKTLTEDDNPGNDFLANVCKAWESESAPVEKSGVRRVNIRTGVVLSKEEGALKQMLLPFRLFVGGPLGNGKQWFPWIHINDLVNIYLFALDNSEIEGPLNAASPGIVTMNDFAKALGKVLHRPAIFKVPKFALKIAIGEFAESILASMKINPKKLLDNNYKFYFEDIKPALQDLIK